MSEQKTALVTGANKGMGFEIVRQLLAEGHRVFLTARNAAAGKEAASGLDGDVHFVQMDVSDDASIQKGAKRYGELSGLSYKVPSYCLSKLALNGVTIMLDQALRSQGIAVYAMCPGWVRTDMGGANAARSVEEGADTAVWLATAAPQTLSGKFFRDRRAIGW